ncbi:MAG: tail fiber domain-containing protein, partial [Microgenomates group bacterium]
NTDPSDINLKTNVLNLPDGTLDKVLGLRTVSYEWKSTGDGALGFVAQEVQQVFPELVGTNNDGTLGLYTTQFIPLLTKAMQEQQLEVNEQKTKLDELIAYVESVINGFKDKFVTKQSIQEELCVGTEENKTCLNKEKIDVILNNLPSPTSTVAPTESPIESPLPSSSHEPIPSASPSSSPSAEPIII